MLSASSQRMKRQTLSGLPGIASNPDFVSPSFLSIDDLWHGLDLPSLMQRDDVLVSTEGIDVTEQLRLHLGLPTKAETVPLFIQRNTPELKNAFTQIIRRNSDVSIAAAIAMPRLFNRVIRPILASIISFILGERNFPLFRLLPAGLRVPEDYQKIFRPLPAYPVVQGDVPGIIATLPGEIGLADEEDARVFKLGRDFILIRFSPGSSRLDRIIDVKNACAVELTPGFRRPFINPATRTFNVQCEPSSHVIIWLEDSVQPHWCQLIRTPHRAVQLPRELDLALVLGKVYGESACEGAAVQFLPDGSIQILDDYALRNLGRLLDVIRRHRGAIEDMKTRATFTPDQSNLLRLVEIVESEISAAWRFMHAIGFDVSMERDTFYFEESIDRIIGEEPDQEALETASLERLLGV